MSRGLEDRGANGTTHFHIHKAQTIPLGTENRNLARNYISLEIHHEDIRNSRTLALTYLGWITMVVILHLTSPQSIPCCSWPCCVPNSLPLRTVLPWPCVSHSVWQMESINRRPVGRMRERAQVFLIPVVPPFTQELWRWLQLLLTRLVSMTPALLIIQWQCFSSFTPSGQRWQQPPNAGVPGSPVSCLALYYTISLPSETKLLKFSKVTSLYRSLWAGSRLFHSSGENSMTTSPNVTNP